MNRLSEKVAIVTGASRGIGRATATLLASEGAKVAVVARSSNAIDEVVRQIQERGGIATGIVCDLSSPEQISSMANAVVKAYGQIDILVNNAFDPGAPVSSILDLSVEQLQRNFDMGPVAYLRTMQACYPWLKKSSGGRVINFGSLAGVVGLAGYGPYNMAKEAVRALTRTAAREWAADNITVNNVLPLAKTWGDDVSVPPPGNALDRFGSPEEDIAPVVLFLASKDAQFLTGYSLTPDGGAIIDSSR
ncbi:SDR family oxidoreductase [Pantoea dispersa]|uniref:SDR family NAD(P)-dependent oxidoreductase n=1 Tax=Pantoea dispersa TaxID=59814 RepID=UPI002DB74A51|nr:SDR family oxidoreductase [Pantoea dispersa]MEB5834892.1 SDR family oxidoreductase [Pantoea dispersa]